MKWRFGNGRKRRKWRNWKKVEMAVGVERRTLGYMVREELQREKLRVSGDESMGF